MTKHNNSWFRFYNYKFHFTSFSRSEAFDFLDIKSEPEIDVNEENIKCSGVILMENLKK